MSVNSLLHYKIVSNDQSKPWLLCVHGAGGNTSTWKYQLESLSLRFQVLLVDLRDHGQSADYPSTEQRYTFNIIVDDVIAVLDHLHLDKIHVMSLSMGSMIVQQMALRRPELVQSAVFAGGVFHVTPAIMAFAHTAWMATRVVPYRWMYLVFSRLVMPKRNHQFARKVYVKQSALLSAEAYDKWIMLYRDFRQVLKSFYLYDFNFPIHLIMGGEDYIFLNAAKRYAAEHKNVTIDIMERCGHICNVEQPDYFNELSMQFFQQANSELVH
ncbi:MAG: pimeloyl-ACP methyl ester carboxylesterase [Cyclobacteriaceae bacterium]|jgi:pimeloyl-ACP methyl ester carboxylesterase